MSHARQQIRDAVATAVTGLATTGSNVFKTRVHKLEQQSLPAVIVYTLQEDAQRETLSPRKQSRMVRVALDIAVQQIDAADAALDMIAAEIEVALEAAWQSRAGVWDFIRDITLNSTAIAMTGEGEQRALGMVLTYTCNYRTLEGAPETLIA